MGTTPKATLPARAAARVGATARTVAAPPYLRYLAKCCLGTAACYGVYAAVPAIPFYWSIVSLLLVLDPDEAESMRLAVARMKANIAGAAVGMAALLIAPPGVASVVAAVVATIVTCELFRLGKASRSALAALIIVMLSAEADWRTGLERMGCVVLGCLVAIALTAAFAAARRRRPAAAN